MVNRLSEKSVEPSLKFSSGHLVTLVWLELCEVNTSKLVRLCSDIPLQFWKELESTGNLIFYHRNTSKYTVSSPELESKTSKYGKLDVAMDRNYQGQEEVMYYSFREGELFKVIW